MIDLHSHILPGIDDGARDLDESVAIARAAAADGISAVAATPHVREDYPTSAGEMEDGVSRLRIALDAAAVEVDVFPGGEIALPEVARLDVGELRRFGLGGNPSYLLVETPYLGWPLAFEAIVARLVGEGITPVIAHPERNKDVRNDPSRLVRLVQAGALVQVTAASLDGRLGRPVRNCTRDLLQRGVVHMLASDAHSPGLRAIGLAAARDAVGDDALGRWLTDAVPAAILADAPLPPRPPAAPRRRRRRLGRRSVE